MILYNTLTQLQGFAQSRILTSSSFLRHHCCNICCFTSKFPFSLSPFTMTNADDNASADDVNMKDASHPPSGVESASDAAHHRASPMKQQQLIREDDHPSIASSVSQEEDEEEEQREEAEDKGKERSEDGDDGDDDDEDMRGGDQQPDDKRGRKSYK